MKHNLKIMVRRSGQKPISIAQFKKLSMLDRIKHRWFGSVEKLMVIVPEKNVQKIQIEEVE